MERSLGMLQKGCRQFSHPSIGEEVRGGTHSPHAHCAGSCRDTGLGAHPSSPSESLPLILGTLALVLVPQASTVQCSSSDS